MRAGRMRLSCPVSTQPALRALRLARAPGGQQTQARGRLLTVRALDPQELINQAQNIDINAVSGAVQEKASEIVSNVDVDAISKEVTGGLAEVGGAVNQQVLLPAWAKAAPELEKYFRGAWGDYYYDYFIDEWESGVKDLGRLYDFLANTVVAGDPKRLAALLGATAVAPQASSLLFGLGRGYRGDVSPSALLQMLEGSEAIFADVRLGSEQQNFGLPDLPQRLAGNYVNVGYAGEWIDPSLRRQMRDTRAMESKATATVIAEVKRASKGAPVVVMDNGGDGRAVGVARALTKDLGFKKVYVLKGGFNAWRQSKLQVRLPSSDKKGTFFSFNK